MPLFHPHNAHLAAVLLCALSLVFFAVPSFDLALSAALYDPALADFALADDWAPRARLLGRLATIGLAVLLLVTLVVPQLCARIVPYATRQRAAALLVALLLGPILVVNALFKDQWGRPRPREIEPFGGEAAFMPVWLPGGACADNCSFSSGEASGATWVALVTITLFGPRIGLIGVLLAAIIATARVMQGGHFLSDTLVSILVTYLLTWLALRAFDPAVIRANRAVAAPSR